MSSAKPIAENDLINGIIWHCECKTLSVQKIIHFKPPADLFDLKMYHSLYLTSLVSITEMMKEYFSTFLPDLYTNLTFAGFTDGEKNYGYLRELRNGIVHRGVDPTTFGTVLDGSLHVISPRPVSDRSGEKTYVPFAETLRELFMSCEVRIGPIVQKHIATMPNYRAKIDPATAAKDLKDTIAKSEAPDWAKAMMTDNNIANEIPFEQIASQRWDELETLLGAPSSYLFPKL